MSDIPTPPPQPDANDQLACVGGPLDGQELDKPTTLGVCDIEGARYVRRGSSHWQYTGPIPTES